MHGQQNIKIKVYIYEHVQYAEQSTMAFRAQAKLSQSLFLINNKPKALSALTYRPVCL
jgi:hypothetical protein